MTKVYNIYETTYEMCDYEFDSRKTDDVMIKTFYNKEEAIEFIKSAAIDPDDFDECDTISPESIIEVSSSYDGCCARVKCYLYRIENMR